MAGQAASIAGAIEIERVQFSGSAERTDPGNFPVTRNFL